MRPENHLASLDEPDIDPSEGPTTQILDTKMQQASDVIPALAEKRADVALGPSDVRAAAHTHRPRVRAHTIVALLVIGASIGGLIAYDLGETRFESWFAPLSDDAEADRSTGE